MASERTLFLTLTSVLGVTLALHALTPGAAPARRTFDPAGRLVTEQVDLDGDGRPDARRHYLYGLDGQLSAVLDADL